MFPRPAAPLPFPLSTFAAKAKISSWEEMQRAGMSLTLGKQVDADSKRSGHSQLWQ